MQHFCNYPPLSVVLYLGCSRNNTVNITQFCVLCFITHCLKLWEFGISSEFPYGVLHVWLPVPSVHERLSLTALLSTRPRLIIKKNKTSMSVKLQRSCPRILSSASASAASPPSASLNVIFFLDFTKCA